MPGIVLPERPDEMDVARDEMIRRDEASPALGPVRFSHLRAYGRSPMHGYHARTRDTEPTYAMERGTAVHALIFGNRKVLPYEGVRRGKAYEEFVTEHPDTEILTASEYVKAQRMAEAVIDCKAAEEWLRGTVETTLHFRHMGMDCRATPDVRGADFLTELKTSASADPERFKWHALRMHYHAQLRWQEYAVAASGGKRVEHHMIVCVESTEPYPVTVFFVEPRALEAGEKLLALWMERLKGCEASGQYPGYSQSAVPLDVPEDDEELVFATEEVA